MCLKYFHNKGNGAGGNVFLLYSGVAIFKFLLGCWPYLVRIFCGFQQSYQAVGVLVPKINP
jgi:hypothetical protein